MSLDLYLVITNVEVLAALGVQLIQHFLMLGIERGWQGQLDHAALDQSFQFAGRLLMILNHLLREWLGVRVRPFGNRELARLDLEHVADRDLVYEVLRCRRASGRGRRLGKGDRGQQAAARREDQGNFHDAHSRGITA